MSAVPSSTPPATQVSAVPLSSCAEVVEAYLAERMLRDVLRHSLTLIEQLEAIALRDLLRAPVDSQYVADLTSHLARTIIDWVEDWPS